MGVFLVGFLLFNLGSVNTSVNTKIAIVCVCLFHLYILKKERSSLYVVVVHHVLANICSH